MIRDAELDRVLTSWLSEGPHRAPVDDVAAALAIVATTPQRGDWRRWSRGPRRATWFPRTRLGLIAVALLLILTAVAIGAGAGLIHLPSQPLPAPTSVPSDARLRPIQVDDWAVRVSIPSTWTEIDPKCCDYRHFGGTSPEGHLSIGHESPYTTAVCSPTCQDIDLHMTTIPYSASAQLNDLKFLVGGTAGSQAWSDLPPDVLPQIEGGARLETTATDDAGREWRRVHIVGLRKRNVVAIAWSQPADRFDPALLDAVLATVELTVVHEPAPAEQVFLALGGRVQLGLSARWERLAGMEDAFRRGPQRLTVRVGGSDGSIVTCDKPAGPWELCREIHATNLEDLAAAVQPAAIADHGVGPLVGRQEAGTLDGEPSVVTRIPTDEYPAWGWQEVAYIVAMHDGRPYILRIRTRADRVVDLRSVIAGFRFLD